MKKTYQNWWLGEGGDQGMEDSHLSAWQNVIDIIDNQDIYEKTVLDFGCNQGGFLRALYKRIPFSHGYGLDIAEAAIKTANSRVGNLPIVYKHTDNPGDFGVSVDTVISTSVLYLIENLEDHFSSIADVLSSGGVYYASFADQSKNPSLEYMRSKIDQYGATKMQNKTLDEVVDALVKCGFTVELRKEHTGHFDVTNYKEFYLSVNDYIQSCEQSYLIKATKKG